MSIRSTRTSFWALLLLLFACKGEEVKNPDALLSHDPGPENMDSQSPAPQGPDWIKGEFKELLRTGGGLPQLSIYPGNDEFVPQLTTGLMADITGDNIPEIIVSTVEHDVYEIAGSMKIGHLVFSYDPDTETLKVLNQDKFPEGRIVLAEDLDGDTYVDLVFSNTTPNEIVAWGGGAGQFNKATSLVDGALLPDQQGNPDPNYPGDMGNDHVLDDVDSDGWLDIVTSGFCGRPQARPFLRTGPRRFTYDEDLFDFLPHGSVWSLHMMRLEQGEHLLMMPGEDGKSCDNHHVFFLKTDGQTDKGHPMFVEFDPLPTAMDLPEEIKFGPRMASPMGLTIGDLNGDELLDIVISQDPHRSILAGTGAWPLEEVSAESGLFMIPSDQGLPMLAWGMALLDLDSDGRADIVSVHGDDDPRFLLESKRVGPQHTTAHWNAGGFKFVDISSQLNIDRRGNWRALSVGDLDRDNKPDLLIGGLGEMPQVLLNRIETPYNELSIRLQGTTSNHLGIGAHIRVQALEDSSVQTFYMGSVGSPVAQSQARVFVGLGSATKAHRVEVLWPSGVLQRVQELDSGTFHVIKEPEVLALSPSSRHVAADGVALAEIRVKPELLSPDADASADVQIEQIYGDAEFAGPAVFDGTAWVRSLTSTIPGGSSVIQVTIDGAPLHVRPRIWWDEVSQSD
jgi:hypothetical protein